MSTHHQTIKDTKMAIHKQHRASPDIFVGFKHSYKGSTESLIRSTQEARQYQPRRSQRLANQHKARTPHMGTIWSSSRSTDSSLEKRAAMKSSMWKQTKATIRPQTISPPPATKIRGKASDTTQPSFLEKLTDGELSRALSYYYDFPENLPFRECGAHRRVDGPVPDIVIKFDENVFARKNRLRPLSEDDLESIDPFSLEVATRR